MFFSLLCLIKIVNSCSLLPAARTTVLRGYGSDTCRHDAHRACRGTGGSARSAWWQRTRKRPCSLPGGPGVRWSPAGGGSSLLRLAWSGRAARGWIGPVERSAGGDAAEAGPFQLRALGSAWDSLASSRRNSGPPTEQCAGSACPPCPLLLSRRPVGAMPQDRPVASTCSRSSMPGPFPAEIRAAPLPSPLPPLPPFLLPSASLFVFFFPATLSGGSSTSSGSARVSSAAYTTARARASLSPSRE